MIIGVRPHPFCVRSETPEAHRSALLSTAGLGSCVVDVVPSVLPLHVRVCVGATRRDCLTLDGGHERGHMANCCRRHGYSLALLM